MDGQKYRSQKTPSAVVRERIVETTTTIEGENRLATRESREKVGGWI